jgi:tetratricopeptide (TPR) repeat protein
VGRTDPGSEAWSMLHWLMVSNKPRMLAMGQEFDLAHLTETARLDEGEALAILNRLLAKGFIEERRIFPEMSFGFDHPLVLEVAYRGLLKERRRDLHRRAFEALATTAGEGCAPGVGRLAHHSHEAELWDQAVRFCRLAARRAAAQSAYQEAAALYRKALAAAAHMPAGAEQSALAIDLRIELRHVLFPAGHFAEIGDLLEQARSAAEALGDRGRLALVLMHITTHHLGAGRHRQAIDVGVRALAIADERGDSSMARDVPFHLVQASASLGDYRDAVRFARRLLDDPPDGAAGGTTTSLVRMWLAWCLAELGAFGEAHSQLEIAYRDAEGTNQPFPMLVAHLGRGLVYLRERRFEEAAACLEVALGLSERPVLRAWWGAVGSPLGRAWAALGRPEQAVGLLERVVSHTASSRGSGHALRSVHLGEAYLLAGRPDAAMQTARGALDLARSHGERGHEAYALLLTAQLALALGNEPEAIACARAAEDIAAELGMKPLQARVREVLDRTAEPR